MQQLDNRNIIESEPAQRIRAYVITRRHDGRVAGKLLALLPDHEDGPVEVNLYDVLQGPNAAPQYGSTERHQHDPLTDALAGLMFSGHAFQSQYDYPEMWELDPVLHPWDWKEQLLSWGYAARAVI